MELTDEADAEELLAGKKQFTQQAKGKKQTAASLHDKTVL
jgi:hypothetical protein